MHKGLGLPIHDAGSLIQNVSIAFSKTTNKKKRRRGERRGGEKERGKRGRVEKGRGYR